MTSIFPVLSRAERAIGDKGMVLIESVISSVVWVWRTNYPIYLGEH